MTEQRTRKVIYRLYGTVLNEESAALPETERYCFIGPGYILVYRRKLRRRPEGWKEMRDLTVLPPAAVEWLREANMEILEEFARKHRESAEDRSGRFLDRFERELEAEARRFHGEQAETPKEGEEATCE